MWKYLIAESPWLLLQNSSIIDNLQSPKYSSGGGVPIFSKVVECRPGTLLKTDSAEEEIPKYFQKHLQMFCLEIFRIYHETTIRIGITYKKILFCIRVQFAGGDILVKIPNYFEVVFNIFESFFAKEIWKLDWSMRITLHESLSCISLLEQQRKASVSSLEFRLG